ncbi:MAG: DinB family protein [Candidatus Obscuribacterales bacterium]|nr:DinB family protein [Candidatus Obscuribacterales bacterium]
MFEPFLLEWKFARGLSLDLLSTLSKDDLSFSPGFGMGPFWKQFRHIGRVQEDYVSAVLTGKVSFGNKSTHSKSRLTQDDVRTHLFSCDEEMLRVLSMTDSETPIDWFGESVRAQEHMWRLVGHETFHHGQWVIYMRGLDKKFPPSWSAWGF